MAKADVVKEFTNIKGIGKAKAEALYDGGFTSLEKLKGAKVADLTKIEGVTDALAKDIVSELKGSSKEEVKPKAPAKKPAAKKVEEKPKAPAKKAEPKKEEVKAEKKEEVKEEPKKEEKKEIKPKKKPELTEEQKDLLEKRKEIKDRTPKFLREEWFRYKRIPKNWRRPDGITSKMRRNYKYKPSRVRVGFRGPKDVRGLHSSGFEEVRVFNANDVQKLDPKTQAARIGSTVGTRKRMEIEKKAKELDIRLLNR